MPGRIRVLIVDDHEMVRQGLALFLHVFDDLELAGEAENGAEALQRCAEVGPDVVLMDLMMPEMDGATAIRAIRERFPAVRVIALTSFQEEGLVQRALQAGAIGYLLKNVSADELAAAIRAAHAGRPTLAPEAARDLIQAAARGPAPGHDLTAREREVLGLLVPAAPTSRPLTKEPGDRRACGRGGRCRSRLRLSEPDRGSWQERGPGIGRRSPWLTNWSRRQRGRWTSMASIVPTCGRCMHSSIAGSAIARRRRTSPAMSS